MYTLINKYGLYKLILMGFASVLSFCKALSVMKAIVIEMLVGKLIFSHLIV